jgi:hypothetical protein
MGNPTKIWGDGEEWREMGLLHRLDGPARWWPNGRQEWYKHGAVHREDGPAIIWSSERNEWWFEGQYLGEGDKGFWKLWDCLSSEKQENFSLLQFLPSKIK